MLLCKRRDTPELSRVQSRSILPPLKCGPALTCSTTMPLNTCLTERTSVVFFDFSVVVGGEIRLSLIVDEKLIEGHAVYEHVEGVQAQNLGLDHSLLSLVVSREGSAGTTAHRLLEGELVLVTPKGTSLGLSEGL